jgi:hypothetical protein
MFSFSSEVEFIVDNNNFFLINVKARDQNTHSFLNNSCARVYQGKKIHFFIIIFHRAENARRRQTKLKLPCHSRPFLRNLGI